MSAKAGREPTDLGQQFKTLYEVMHLKQDRDIKEGSHDPKFVSDAHAA